MFNENENQSQKSELVAKEKVVIEMENGGIIRLELYPEAAPITVANFVKLVKEGFYNGLTFHRVIRGFMIQGGDPLGNGMGGSDNNIKGEFRANGVNNPIKHVRGVISMARAYDPNSASSQFFIMHENAPHLDGQYAAFGKVIEGMDAVDEIAAVATDFRDRPRIDMRMKHVTIEK
jgi:peptidyl-prolyl cis-trans isomerase B (cyclophilin B)